jgi:type IV secretion system protein TrbG
MNRKVCPSLVLCLLVAGTVLANEDPGRSAPATPVEVQVPNIPPELAAPPQQPPGAISPDPALLSADVKQPDTAGAQVPTPQVPPPPLPEAPPRADNNCDTADCTTDSKPPVTKSKDAPSVHIGVPAQRALSESHDWAENPQAVPSRDTGGRVVFAFNESAPTIVCAPLHVCDIELQAGEVIQGAPHIGDSVRWKITPAISGADDNRVIHLIVKPTEAGLDTNLIVPTDRHTYHIRLVSSVNRYVSSVGFLYPEEDSKAWTDFAKSSGGNGSTRGAGDMPIVAVNRLNFDYKIKVVKGKPTFRPLRAMDDGYHTYIAMNEDLPQGEAPVLIGISPAGAEQMVNYRLKGNLYVIDGTLNKMAFVSGVGRQQQRIELSRDPCKRRGWLGICWDPKD